LKHNIVRCNGRRNRQAQIGIQEKTVPNKSTAKMTDSPPPFYSLPLTKRIGVGRKEIKGNNYRIDRTIAGATALLALLLHSLSRHSVIKLKSIQPSPS
jgi:hypothetical protein